MIEAALSRTLAGRRSRAPATASAAVAELERAAATLDACGAPRYRDAAERELRKLGQPSTAARAGQRRRRRRRRRSPSASCEVAALVVDRKTNPEIAAELFLSLKTVETHLRNIFRKLDVSSRVELARAVERAGRAS